MGRLKFIFLFCFLLFSSCERLRPKGNFAEAPTLKFDLDQIKKRGYINALVDNNSFSYFIYKGRSLGYEYELLQSLSKALKVQVKIKLISGIEEAIDKLNRGEGDIIAFPLTITQDRQEFIAFSDVHFNTCQVLVQRVPSLNEKGNILLRNPVDLIGKQVYVMKESSYKTRLENLSQEMGGPIIIKEDSASNTTESLLEK